MINAYLLNDAHQSDSHSQIPPTWLFMYLAYPYIVQLVLVWSRASRMCHVTTCDDDTTSSTCTTWLGGQLESSRVGRRCVKRPRRVICAQCAPVVSASVCERTDGWDLGLGWENTHYATHGQITHGSCIILCPYKVCICMGIGFASVAHGEEKVLHPLRYFSILAFVAIEICRTGKIHNVWIF